jgi:hypothetical protein
MSDSVKAFVDRQNIVRYFELLETETDSIRRSMLSKLLAEEMAKRDSRQEKK